MTDDAGRRAAIEIARRILAARYPAAAAAVVAGSRMRGAAHASSDLDIVVLFDALPHAHRESFLWSGTPVEAFVNDPGTLRWFLHADVENGRPVMIDMVAEGEIVGPDPGLVEPLRAEARTLRAAGPPPLGEAALRVLRYRITDLLDDLRAPRPGTELRAIGCALHDLAGDLVLRGRGRWAARGKWIPRDLATLDPALAGRFDGVFRALFATEDPAPVLALLRDELDRHGGPLFDGDRRDAPAGWRLTSRAT